MQKLRLALTIVVTIALSSCFGEVAEEKQDFRTKTNQRSKDSQPGVDKGIPLSEQQQVLVKEMATILELTEAEVKILTDLLMRDHPAIEPLHKLIKNMDSKLAPYVKSKWLLFSEHQLILKKTLEEKQTEFEALKKELDQNIGEKAVRIEELTLELENLQTQYDEVLKSWQNATKEIAYLLGHTDREGRALESIIIADSNSATALATTIIINGRSSALRALASYAGSTTPRDISHLTSWTINQSNDLPTLQQDAISPYIFKALRLGSDATVKASIKIKDKETSSTVSVAVRDAVNVAYNFYVYSDKSSSMVEPAAIPLGVRGRLILKARFTNERGELITESDVTGSATFSIAQQDQEPNYTGTAVLLNTERRLRPGLFYGTKTGAIKIRATIDNMNIDKDVMLNAASDEFYFYAGIPILMSEVADKLEYIECGLPHGLILHQFEPSQPRPDDEDEYRSITFAGTTIGPGLHAFRSSCELTDVSALAKFTPASPATPADAIKKIRHPDQTVSFIAHRPTARSQPIAAYWDDSQSAKIKVVNQWAISIEYRRLTDLIISSERQFQGDRCYEWRANELLTGPTVEDLDGGGGPIREDRIILGAGTQIRDFLVIDSDLTRPDMSEPALTYASPLSPGQTAGSEHIFRFGNGLKGFAIDFDDLVGIVDRDGTLMPGAALNSEDIAVFQLRENELDPVAAEMTIEPGARYQSDRVMVRFNAAAQNTWLKIIVRRSTKTGVINEWVGWIGHFTAGSEVSEFTAPAESNENFVDRPFQRSLSFDLTAVWNGCRFESIQPGPGNLTGNMTLGMVDPEGQPTAELGSFGRRWQQTKFTYNPRRPDVDRNVLVRASFDFSQRCYRPDPNFSPEECQSLSGYRDSNSESPILIEKPRISNTIGIENFYPPVCQSIGFGDSPGMNPNFPRLTTQTTDLRLIALREESYLDEQFQLKCEVPSQAGITPSLRAFSLDYVQSLDPIDSSDLFNWRLQLKPDVSRAFLRLSANLDIEGQSNFSREFSFQIDLPNQDPNCLRNARLHPENQEMAMFEIAPGVGPGPWNQPKNTVYINRSCGIKVLRIINSDFIDHSLRTQNRPCPSQPNPSKPNEFYDCRLDEMVQPTDPSIYDARFGPGARFYLHVD